MPFIDDLEEGIVSETLITQKFEETFHTKDLVSWYGLLKMSLWRSFAHLIAFYAKNNAAEVVSFTTIHSVTKLFSLLSGYERKVVGRYLKKSQGGRRKEHKVKILISDNKDLAFVYKFRKEQLTICYNYGEWNIHGSLNIAN